MGAPENDSNRPVWVEVKNKRLFSEISSCEELMKELEQRDSGKCFAVSDERVGENEAQTYHFFRLTTSKTEAKEIRGQDCRGDFRIPCTISDYQKLDQDSQKPYHMPVFMPTTEKEWLASLKDSKQCQASFTTVELFKAQEGYTFSTQAAV